MIISKKVLVGALASTLLLSFGAGAQPAPRPNWPAGGPGPYSPYGAGRYRAANPYARELNQLAVKDPAKHDACFKQANDKNLRREARWKFMLECMKK